MKSLQILCLSLCLIGLSCQGINLPGDINAGLIGKWELIETRLDPGNGGGSFHPISSDASIEFSSDETFKANFNICSLDISDSENSLGTYSAIENTITPDDCHWNDQGFLIRFEIDVEDRLIISYPCIEPCQYKYEKVR